MFTIHRSSRDEMIHLRHFQPTNDSDGLCEYLGKVVRVMKNQVEIPSLLDCEELSIRESGGSRTSVSEYHETEGRQRNRSSDIHGTA